VLALAAVPAASSQLAAAPRNLPSSTVPNAAGSIRVPTPLSRAPARPETRTYEQLVTLWKQAGEGYGVPWQVLGAINKIESGYGQNMGPSSAGAVGWMQFMPSTWMRWGMDADRNGLADPWDPEDAVFAAARYLAAAGAHESIDRAIFAYNHAQWYVDDVLALASTLGDAPFTVGPPTLTTDPGPDLGKKLEKARARVQRLSEELDLALGRIGERDWQRLRLERRLGDPDLGDAEFAKLDARLADLDRSSGRRRRRSTGSRPGSRRRSRRSRRSRTRRRRRRSAPGLPAGATSSPSRARRPSRTASACRAPRPGTTGSTSSRNSARRSWRSRTERSSASAGTTSAGTASGSATEPATSSTTRISPPSRRSRRRVRR
jgi:hypothetical protein